MTLKVPLTNGEFALVDDQDAWVLDYRWGMREDKRTPIALKPHPRPGTPLRRIIADPKPGQAVYHRNGNSLDCRRENLTSVHPNAFQPEDGDPEVIRVFENTSGDWVSTVMIDGVRKYVGTFPGEREAVRAAEVHLDKVPS